MHTATDFYQCHPVVHIAVSIITQFCDWLSVGKSSSRFGMYTRYGIVQVCLFSQLSNSFLACLSFAFCALRSTSKISPFWLLHSGLVIVVMAGPRTNWLWFLTCIDSEPEWKWQSGDVPCTWEYEVCLLVLCPLLSER